MALWMVDAKETWWVSLKAVAMVVLMVDLLVRAMADHLVDEKAK